MDWKKQFKEPPRKYAVYPIVHSRISQADEYVDMHDRQGFGGVVGNLDYTPEFPNDTAEWEKAVNGFRTYMERGMGAWIYDEKGYPSGTAGGAVLEENPDYEALGVLCLQYWMQLTGPVDYRLDVPDGNLISVLLVPVDGASDATTMFLAGETDFLSANVGDVMDGTVETLKDYGAFVRLENGLSGLVHVSQISDKRVTSPSKVLKEGETVKVKVTAIKDGKLSLSMKALIEKEEVVVEEEEKFELPKSENIATSLGSLLANLKL